jgi:hypothetical protein
MKYQRSLLFLLLLAVFPAIAAAQVQSLASLPAGETFTSEQGKFAIALPKEPANQNPVKTEFEMGSDIWWRTKEGSIKVRFAKNSDPAFVFTKKDNYKSFFIGIRTAVMGDLGAKTSNEGSIKLGEHRGYQFRFDTNSNTRGLVRVYVVGTTYYILTGYANKNVAGSEDMIARAFDSFKLL